MDLGKLPRFPAQPAVVVSRGLGPRTGGQNYVGGRPGGTASRRSARSPSRCSAGRARWIVAFFHGCSKAHLRVPFSVAEPLSTNRIVRSVAPSSRAPASEVILPPALRYERLSESTEICGLHMLHI